MKKIIVFMFLLLCGISYGAAVGETDSGEGVVVFNAASNSDLSALDTAYKAADSNLQSQVDGKVNVTNGVFQSTWTVRYTDTNSVVKLKTYSINPTNGVTQATTVNE